MSADEADERTGEGGGGGLDWPGDEPGEPARPGRRSGEHWIVLGCALLSAIVIVLLVTVAHPDPRGYGTHEQLGLPPCRAMEWLGVPCPGCGVTTSVALALDGELRASFANQPFGFLVAFALPLFVLWALAGHLLGRDLYRDALSPRARPLLHLGLALLLAGWLWKIWRVWGAS